MTTFRLQITSLGRSASRRAMAAATDRPGERIRDEHSRMVQSESRRREVVHIEVVVPAKQHGVAVDWARDRSRLWKVAEQAESRRAARVAREFQVTLPAQLSGVQRLSLARAFSRELANRYGIAVDLAIHEPSRRSDPPSRDSDPRNFHAHLLATTREVTPAGMGARAALEMHPRDRLRLGLPSLSHEFTAIRARWATLTNQALRAASIEARRSGPRSLEEIRRDAARTWLQMRHGVAGSANELETSAVHEPAGERHEGRGEERHEDRQPGPRQRDRGIDDDYVP